jgi:hypothetical protein
LFDIKGNAPAKLEDKTDMMGALRKNLRQKIEATGLSMNEDTIKEID